MLMLLNQQQLLETVGVHFSQISQHVLSKARKQNGAHLFLVNLLIFHW